MKTSTFATLALAALLLAPLASLHAAAASTGPATAS
jgi:hypothetical protein